MPELTSSKLQGAGSQRCFTRASGRQLGQLAATTTTTTTTTTTANTTTKTASTTRTTDTTRTMGRGWKHHCTATVLLQYCSRVGGRGAGGRGGGGVGKAGEGG